MKKWEIKDYKNEAINWEEVPALQIDQYPWYEKGLKQKTDVQIVIAEDKIHIHAKAEDKHIKCAAKELNDPVFTDSCFEFFVTPWDQRAGTYFNIEMSCIGVLYMAYKDGKGGTKYITEEQAKRVIIESSLKNSKDVKKELGWELKIIIPISVLEEISQREIKKDIWYGNFYRCGGEEDDQYATWSPIEFEKPNFHLPMQFGKLTIKDQ